MSADNAIPLGLMNVIVTNSAKHAYPEGSGEIRVSGERRGAELPGLQGDQELLVQLNRRIAVTVTRPKGVIVQLDVPLEIDAA